MRSRPLNRNDSALDGRLFLQAKQLISKPAPPEVDRSLTHKRRPLAVAFSSVPFYRNWYDIDHPREMSSSSVIWPQFDSITISWSISSRKCPGMLLGRGWLVNFQCPQSDSPYYIRMYESKVLLSATSPVCRTSVGKNKLVSAPDFSSHSCQCPLYPVCPVCRCQSRRERSRDRWVRDFYVFNCEFSGMTNDNSVEKDQVCLQSGCTLNLRNNTSGLKTMVRAINPGLKKRGDPRAPIPHKTWQKLTASYHLQSWIDSKASCSKSIWC